jgi:hypothetical protein
MKRPIFGRAFKEISKDSTICAPINSNGVASAFTFRESISRFSCSAGILLLAITLCVSADKEHPVYPKKFLEAASVFKSAPTTNRLNEANAVSEALPDTPVTSGRGPTDIRQHGSRFELRDYNKPSFFLSQSEVARLLGSPSSTNSTDYIYLVLKEGENKPEVFLTIIFHNGYVVQSVLYSSPSQPPQK